GTAARCFWYRDCISRLSKPKSVNHGGFAMQIELCCSTCACRFAAPPETGCEEVIDRMFDQGPRYALGDGETFEDMIFNTFMEHGQITCPDCGDPVGVSEESLGQLAMDVLAQW